MSYHSELDYTLKNDPDAAPAPVRQVVFDPESRDYAMYLDDQLIGYARSSMAAEQTLDEVVYERLAYQAERDLLALSAAYKAAWAAGDEAKALELRARGRALFAVLYPQAAA